MELAKYVLLRLVNNQNSIEMVAKDFDNDVRFILGEVDFLKDIGWVEQGLTSGIYQITENGKMDAKASKWFFGEHRFCCEKTGLLHLDLIEYGQQMPDLPACSLSLLVRT